MAKRGMTIEGPFVPHRRVLILSPASRVLSLVGRKILDRLELEVMNHGGKENGRLAVTFEQFISFGVHRNGVAKGVREVVALGLVVITEPGRAGNAGYRKPSRYRLTYLSSHMDLGGQLYKPTDEWRLIKTIEEAERIAAAARNSRSMRNPKATSQKDTVSPTEMVGEAGYSPAPKKVATTQPPKRGVLSISGLSSSEVGPEDVADVGSRKRHRLGRSIQIEWLIGRIRRKQDIADAAFHGDVGRGGNQEDAPFEASKVGANGKKAMATKQRAAQSKGELSASRANEVEQPVVRRSQIRDYEVADNE
jgi:hypothetical protein